MDDHVVIALFRHGLTEENKRKAYLGWNDSPLCPEANGLATSSTYECLFSSDLKRCVSTAKHLFPNKNCILLAELREMNFGKWQGKTYEELKDEPLYQQWIDDPFNISPPDGEAFGQFSKRVLSGWSRITDKIIANKIQRCAVISHAGVVRYLLSKFAPEIKEFWSWRILHKYGFELVFERELLRRGGRCTLLQVVPLTEKEHG